MESKKLIIYEDKKTKSLFICPTNEKFKIKDTKTFGKAVSKNISNEELGKLLKNILKEAD
jgi:hypothetical protein